MAARTSVLGGVAVRGGITAERRAASLARTQMDPARADFDAFLALVVLCVLDAGDAVDVSAAAGHDF